MLIYINKQEDIDILKQYSQLNKYFIEDDNQYVIPLQKGFYPDKINVGEMITVPELRYKDGSFIMLVVSAISYRLYLEFCPHISMYDIIATIE